MSIVRIFIVAGLLSLVPGASGAAQDFPSAPIDLDVLTGQIDNSRVYGLFLRGGQSLTTRTDVLSPAEISMALKNANRRADVAVPNLPTPGKLDYGTLAKSSLLFGTVYDCGRCNNLHASIAGGVIVSNDGLAITNYHVVDRNDRGTEEVFAMTFDGVLRPIVKVLSANKTQDVALVQLGGVGPFFPTAIASEIPSPLEPATVLSHPSNQFFVLTQGVVSRHVTLQTRRGVEQWMEITADYGAGSSGSGVFNSRGEIIGLVSRNSPIIRDDESKNKPPIESAKHLEPTAEPIERQSTHQGKLKSPDYENDRSFVELVLRRCVTLEAIRSRFAE